MSEQRLLRFVSVSLVVAATSCSGGLLGGGGGGGPANEPANSMAPQPAFEVEDIDHLLARTEFGITTSSRTAAQTMGVPAFVEAMLAFETDQTTAVEAEAFQELVDAGDPAGLEGMFPSSDDIQRWWLHIMLNTETPFQERLAMFFHDHFAVSTTVLAGNERYMMVDHIEKLRDQGIGNFKDLVLTMARDPAMLEWLDGTSSVQGDPNENFAREFFELFTVGADRGYTEQDIVEAARAFTGYRNRFDGTTNLRYIEFDQTRKDQGAKVLFADVVLFANPVEEDDYDLVVDATFETLDVAGWLAEKLLLEFVTDAPNPPLIANLAQVIRSNDYEMRPILRTLFLSQAFYSRKKEMVRMPVDYGIGIARSTNLLISSDNMRRELDDLAQTPAEPPSVFGWPQGPEWLSAAGMVERANLARRLIGERTFQSNNGFDIALPSGTPTAEQVVDHFAGLMGVSLSDDERSTLITYLDTQTQNGGGLVDDPFDVTVERDVNERVRGLVYILASHPDTLAR